MLSAARRPALLGIALLAPLLLAACSAGSSTAAGTTATAPASPAASSASLAPSTPAQPSAAGQPDIKAFADCMAKQGVTLPSRGPGSDDGDGDGNGDGNGDVNGPADGGDRTTFDAARKACAAFAPPGGFGDGGPGREQALPSAPANASTTAPITMAVVAQHSTPADCWTVVDSKVYDVTTWIPMHPGGSAVIEAICGADGTSAFNGQHQGQGEPGQVLAALQVGVLSS